MDTEAKADNKDRKNPVAGWRLSYTIPSPNCIKFHAIGVKAKST
jgi:hypothetical protein